MLVDRIPQQREGGGEDNAQVRQGDEILGLVDGGANNAGMGRQDDGVAVN